MRFLSPKVQVIEVTVGYTNRDIVYELEEVTESCSSLVVYPYNAMFSSEQVNELGRQLSS